MENVDDREDSGQGDVYRTPASVDIEPTDAEIAFWEQAVCARLSKGSHSSGVDEAVRTAEQAMMARRKRFGRR